MRKHIVQIFFFALLPLFSFSQIEDCSTALPVCGNGDIALVPTGTGKNDFVGGNRLPSCFRGENKTTWLRIKIKQAGTLGFTLIPDNRTGPNRDDYDFGVYGPNRSCGNLGPSIRCSTTNPQNANVQAETGMNGSETDTSEGPGSDGNGFVRWLDNTKAGEVYYIFIDNFSQNKGYKLQWTGTALLEDQITKEEGGVDLGPDINLCDNDETVLNATTTGGKAYSWNTGETTPTITIDDEGEYRVTVTNSSGCISKDTINVSLIPAPNINFIQAEPNNICEPASIQLSTNGSDGLYEWINPSGTKIGTGTQVSLQNLNANDSGQYKVRLTRENGCIDEKEITVKINPLPQLVLDGRTHLCEFEPLTLSVSGAKNYQWISPSRQTINSTNEWNKTTALNDAGEYTIIGTSIDNCIDSIKFNLKVDPELNITTNTNDITICSTDTLKLNATINSNSATIDWKNAKDESIGTGNSIAVSNLNAEDSGLYKAIVTNTIGCVDIDTIDVRINQAYLFEQTVERCPGNFFIVPQTGEKILQSDTITVELKTQELCDSNYVYNVNYFDCGDIRCTGIPSSFSPNGNGINDLFKPIFSQICNPTSINLKIFNRWGELVINSNDSKGWDGTFKGKKAQTGFYIWQLKYVFPDNPEKEYQQTGGVTLVR